MVVNQFKDNIQVNNLMTQRRITSSLSLLYLTVYLTWLNNTLERNNLASICILVFSHLHDLRETAYMSILNLFWIWDMIALFCELDFPSHPLWHILILRSLLDTLVLEYNRLLIYFLDGLGLKFFFYLYQIVSLWNGGVRSLRVPNRGILKKNPLQNQVGFLFLSMLILGCCSLRLYCNCLLQCPCACLLLVLFHMPTIP